jgi:hypothetical protein
MKTLAFTIPPEIEMVAPAEILMPKAPKVPLMLPENPVLATVTLIEPGRGK